MVVKSFTYQGFEGEVAAPFEPSAYEAAVKPAPVEVVAPIIPEAPKPIFTTDDMEVAKNLAKEEGLREGYEKAKAEFEAQKQSEEAVEKAQNEQLVEKVSAQLAALTAKAQESKQKTSDKISQISLAIAKKVCGDVSDKIMEAEISKILAESVQKLDADERIKIYASPKNAEYLNARFAGMAINVDPTMELGDFRIEWRNGFAQRDVKKIWNSINEICGRHSSLEENETEDNN